MRNQQLRLANYIHDSAFTASLQWKERVLGYYSDSHDAALREVSALLGSAAAAETQVRNLALTVLSVVSGGIITNVYASLFLKLVTPSIQRRIAAPIQHVSSIYPCLSGDPPAGFVAGGLAREASNRRLVPIGVSRQIHRSISNTLASESSEWISVRTHLDRYIGSVRDEIWAILNAIQGNPEMTPDMRLTALEKLATSPFLYPPDQVDTSKLKEQMELALYMQVVLDSDFMGSMYRGPGGGMPRRIAPIDPLPGSPQYPTHVERGNGVFRSPMYEELPRSAEGRINELIGIVLPEEAPLYPNSWNWLSKDNSADSVLRADELLEKLAKTRMAKERFFSVALRPPTAYSATSRAPRF